MCIEEAYLIVSFVILTYLSYKTITNIIRSSKGSPTKNYRFMYACLNYIIEDDEPTGHYSALFCGVFLPFVWPIHWAIYIIYKCFKLIILPLLTRLTLSKEERVQVVIGAVEPNEKWK